MIYLIAYDITENKIRRKIAKFLEGVAYRRQYSVFWANLNEREAEQVRDKVKVITEKIENCTVLMVPLCQACKDKLWLLGNDREEYRDFILV